MTYLERLAARSAAVGSVLCLGIDPDPDALPPGFSADLRGIERFSALVLEAAAPYAAAVKPNLAFFEAYGAAGIAALERIRAAVPEGIPVVLDAKRGDIGSTAARHAVALFDHLGADAVTLSPYLGPRAIEPLLERSDRFCYVLCRTSNPGAGDVQDLVVSAGPDGMPPAEPLHARVARMATNWGPGGTVGLVVGATAPEELEAIRRIAPGLAFLVPGVGAQGGEPGPVLEHGRAVAAPAGGRAGGGLLVNVSRGIAGAARGGAAREGPARAGGQTRGSTDETPGSADPLERVDAAARAWSAALPVLP